MLLKQAFSIFPLLFLLNGYGQSPPGVSAPQEQVMEVTGDLNRDSLPDKVTILRDNTAALPYQLHISFKEKDGEYNHMVSAPWILNPEHHRKHGLPDVFIRNGLLIIDCNNLNEDHVLSFVFRNGNFELIAAHRSFSSVDHVNGFVKTMVDYDLVKRTMTQRAEWYKPEKVSVVKDDPLLMGATRLQDLGHDEY